MRDALLIILGALVATYVYIILFMAVCQYRHKHKNTRP